MNKKTFTLAEAIAQLDLYNKLDAVLDSGNISKKSFPSTWNDNYDFLDEQEITEATVNKRGKVIPEVGDIAVLKIKLREPNAPDKLVYEGYERRPVLIIRATSNKVDAVEITHNRYFEDYKLIPIGKLGVDDRYSYVNIYTVEDYTDLPTSYRFPKFNIRTKKPLTKAEFNAIKIGVIYNGPDKDEPYIADFNYRDNVKAQLDPDLVSKVISAVIEYYETHEKN